MVIFVDFKKAFDSIEWDYLSKVLDVFNFKDNFKKWIKVFYTDVSSCVLNEGFASPFFNLERGVRQGCLLLGLLFVLGVELLNLAILANPSIKGLSVGNKVIKITLYAVDTTLLLKDVESVHSLLEMLELLKMCCGLEINKSKMEAMWLGSWREHTNRPFGFRWPMETIYALGIHFSYNLNLCNYWNFESKLSELEKLPNSWKRRKLMLLGKINIVKSLGLSKLIFKALVLPIPEDFAKRVDAVTFDFIWDRKPHKIKKTTLTGD